MQKARAGLVVSEWFPKGGRRMMCSWTRLSAPKCQQESFSTCARCSVISHVSAASRLQGKVQRTRTSVSVSLESCLFCMWIRTLQHWRTNRNSDQMPGATAQKHRPRKVTESKMTPGEQWMGSWISWSQWGDVHGCGSGGTTIFNQRCRAASNWSDRDLPCCRKMLMMLKMIKIHPTCSSGSNVPALVSKWQSSVPYRLQVAGDANLLFKMWVLGRAT